MNALLASLHRFVQHTLSLCEDKLLRTEVDLDWRSDCEVRVEGDLSLWKPCPQHPAVNFAGLANAVDAQIHSDIVTYYSAFWSGSLAARSKEGFLSLIQLWNQDDFDRLIANLIGHYLHQKKQKRAFSVFFATTEPNSELFLSIDNQTGRILLEEPGRAPIKQVATDLTTFINRLAPVLRRPEIF